MAYNPCSFDRNEYLEFSELFETKKIQDAQNELTEFNDDAEDLAFELAYTRYRLAKAEKAIRAAIDDSESGDGWGPDVTIVRHLTEALNT